MALNWQAATDFANRLYRVIEALEAPNRNDRLNLHRVNGNWTIGVGFDLQAGGPTVQEEVLIGLGLHPAEVRLALSQANPTPPAAGTRERIEYDYARQLRDAMNAGSQTQLNSIMAARAANTDPAYSTWSGLDRSHTGFAFANDTEVRTTFDRLWPTYQNKIFTRYPELRNDTAFATSREAIVLASLIWNGPPNGPSSLLGAKLQDALLCGDRAEAWYQIRYGSNSAGQAQNVREGLAKRRFLEAELFGLYSDVPTVEEARQAYRMLTLHRADILNYERRSGIWEDDQGALSTRNMVVAANGDYASITGLLQAGTVREAYEPAKALLLGEILALYPSIAGVAAGIISTQILLDPNGNAGSRLDARDHLLVPLHPDTGALDERLANNLLIGEGGADYLIGGMGNDVLIGGADADGLYGGAGQDRYVFRNGDGADMILDNPEDGHGGDGQGEILFDGQSLSGTYSQKDANNQPGLYGNATWNLDFNGKAGERGMLVITKVGGSDRIVIPDFLSGDLGIVLGAPVTPVPKPVSSAAPSTMTTAWYTPSHDVLDARGEGPAQLAAVGDHGEVWGSGVLRGNGFDNYLHNGGGSDELYGEGDDELLGGADNDLVARRGTIFGRTGNNSTWRLAA